MSELGETLLNVGGGEWREGVGGGEWGVGWSSLPLLPPQLLPPPLLKVVALFYGRARRVFSFSGLQLPPGNRAQGPRPLVEACCALT